MFTNALCLLQAPLVKRPQVLGNCRDGLYFLCTKCLKTSDRINTCQIFCYFPNNSLLSSSMKNKACTSFSTNSCPTDQCKMPIFNTNKYHGVCKSISNSVPLKC